MQSLTLVRIGAFGDYILMSAVLPFLQKKYSEINFEVNMKGLDLFLNDPRFKYLSVFEADDLSEEKRYDILINRWKIIEEDCKNTGRKYLNMWSSIENSCILHEFNPDVALPIEERRIKYNKNYYENTFEMAEVSMPNGWIHENTLYFKEHEIGLIERWAERNKDFFRMLVPLGGSSRQKVFIWMQDFCKKLIDEYPKLKIYLLGGNELARDVWDYERTFSYVNGHNPANVSFKQAVLMTKYADYVLGPETGLLIGAGMMGTPKTMLFTISDKDQTVNYHRNDFSLQSKFDCSPCYVLAHSGNDCETESTYNAFPKCTTEYDLDEIHNIFDKLYCEKF